MVRYFLGLSALIEYYHVETGLGRPAPRLRDVSARVSG
jgi:hypothetical protein